MTGDWVETHREAWDDSTSKEFICPTCGRKITLWFNGGELDMRECCSVRYQLEATGYEFVTLNKETS